MFLPLNNEDPVLVIKKISMDASRKSSFDSGIGLQEEDQRRGKKSVAKMASTDKNEQVRIIAELVQRLNYINDKMAALEKESEDIQQQQRGSNEFQIQVMKKSDAPDLEKGVTKILDMVQFDRKQELTRLIKKAEDFKRRHTRGTKMDGDDDELRDLLIATGDLEKKTLKGFDEIARLQIKTETVVVRQKEQEQLQKQKREAIAMNNGTMRVLLSDAKVIDSILTEVREFQNTEQKEGEKSVQEFFTLMGENAIDTIKEDIQIIETYKKETETLKEDVWEDRLESNRIQTAVVDQDPEVNVVAAADALRAKIQNRKKKTKEIKQEYEEFLRDQKKRYDVLLKTKREEAEKARLKAVQEEEERKKKEEEDAERLRLKKIAEEAERKRRAEEEALKKMAEEEERKRQADQQKFKQEQLQKKHEAQNILNKHAKDLQNMKIEAERVEMQQREIEMVHEKRAEVCIEATGLTDNRAIEMMLQEFTDFSEGMQNNEDEVVRLGRLLVQPDSDADELLDMTQTLGQSIDDDWGKLDRMKTDSENRLATQKKLLMAQMMEIKRREDEAREALRRAQEDLNAATSEAERLRLLAEQQRLLLEEEERKRRIREEEEAARYAEEERRKRNMEEAERLKRMQEEEEERLRRLKEEEEARQRMLELQKLEANIKEQEEEIKEIEEEWREFDWDDLPWDGEYAGELLGCLSNPAFLYGIRDPKKIIEIIQRAARMKELRERMRADAKKMEWICNRISEMIEEARIAEEKRWQQQNKEWIKDDPVFSPADMICSTHEAAFVSTSKFSLEESRKLAAERKKSRDYAKLCPATMQELAKHSDYSIEDLEGGYGSWSRKRVNDSKSSSSGGRKNRLN
eukprot:GFUD01008810.1.p1 GENE.GFUD01008810.1~~GFUD01008810.1.p1  ORF type:complete len:981 (+),score=281.44 GFUD01008810.1:365-2944(+)